MTLVQGESVEPGQERRRRFGGPVLTWVITLLATAFVLVALWRLMVSGLFGYDGIHYTAAVLALTPYVAGAGVVLAVLAALLRRWRSAVIVFALTAALWLMLLPRMIGDAQPPASGPVLRVLTVNMYYGEADAAAVVETARTNAIDVLAISELTPEAASALEDAGIADVLPHQHFESSAGATGTGLASRYPLEPADLVTYTTFRQPSASFDVEGRSVEVVAVHAMPPVHSYHEWREDLRKLPGADKQGAVRILAGDFNATLDHAEYRRLLDLGYVDAADQVGSGLTGTWPQEGITPPVAIDHVLVDTRIAVRNFRTVDIGGTDHTAVLATLRLPAAPVTIGS